MTRQPGEAGFVLIGAVWLLLLATALVALLMLHARNTAQAASREGLDLQRELDLDAATQTIAAELLIKGPASPWWRLPGQGTVTVDGRPVDVTVTSEAGRLDLNAGDPAVIARALQGLGYEASARERFIDALLTRRTKGRIGSASEIDALAVLLGSGGVVCPQALFTVDSGLAHPDLGRAPSALASAIGTPAEVRQAQLQLGESIRIAAAARSGSAMSSVVRVGLSGTTPIAESWRSLTCQNPEASTHP